LLELKERFNVIPLLELLPMASVNSQRLYEVLWHDSFKGQKQFLTYNLDQLRFQLGLRTSQEVKGREVWIEKYASWRDFQKVLKRAQADFLEHGSLSFDYEGISQGRTTTQVRFRISRKQDNANSETGGIKDPILEVQKGQLAARLEAAGYHQDALQAVETYGLDVVDMALKLALEAERTGARSAKPIYNPGGLIHHALKSGLAKRRLMKPDMAAEPKSSPRQLARALVEAFTAARHSFAASLWDTMSPDDQRNFPGIMQIELSAFHVAQLDKNNWEGALFESSKRELLLSLYADELPDELVDIERFAEHQQFLKDYNPKLSAAVLAECKVLL
jgi:hypothetical protein